MKKMFRVSHSKWDKSFDERLVVKTTDKSVFFIYETDPKKETYRELKSTEHHSWFNTKEEAFKHKEKLLISDIKYYQEELFRCNQRLDEFYNSHKDIKRDLVLNDLIN